MRHRVQGRKLGRTTSHRKALLRNMVTSLMDKERITTTLMKAKELRPVAEKMITLGKRESLHARRQALATIQDRRVVGKLFDTLSARYAGRPGGYTRIYRLGRRLGDGAEMAILELVDAELVSKKKKDEKEKKVTAVEAKAKVEKAKTEKAKARKKARTEAKAAEEKKKKSKSKQKETPTE